MASSSTIQRVIPLSHSTPNSDFKCAANIMEPDDDVELENDVQKSAKFRFNRGHALLRRQYHKHILIQHPKTFGKRRFTFSGYQDHKPNTKKRRRFTSVALPTKFLLGGDITDPLNLRSLEDEKINQQLNAFTPASSPIPISRHRTQVKLLIPPNIYDPLNLNTGEEIEFNLLSSKPRKRRRHRKSRRDDNENVLDTKDILPAKEESENEPPTQIKSSLCLPLEENHDKERKADSSAASTSSEEKVISDKIVSPVVPQGSPAKFYKRFRSRSFSKDPEEKTSALKQVTKRRRSRTRFQQKVDTLKFRANAQKFCYGNHMINHSNWYFGNSDEDHRLRFFDKSLFEGKDVLDIGCNTGQLTLYIAKNWQPRKIIGIDIDKKLINIAQRKVRKHLSQNITEDNDFPESLSSMYGPIIKLAMSTSNSSVFPDNVSFLEANYVPACEEYLETQKPEFDTILCLRATKWIHLNFGDEGLKLAFKRMFAQLRVGGHLILEPQPWFTYSASKRITPAIYKMYCSLEIKPDSFCEYLLSDEVGFSRCELIGRTFNCTKVSFNEKIGR
ncbi:7SK snRNA methylphosphate capping enzyme, partial [Stegodyphus mimosarum]